MMPDFKGFPMIGPYLMPENFSKPVSYVRDDRVYIEMDEEISKMIAIMKRSDKDLHFFRNWYVTPERVVMSQDIIPINVLSSEMRDTVKINQMIPREKLGLPIETFMRQNMRGSILNMRGA